MNQVQWECDANFYIPISKFQISFLPVVFDISDPRRVQITPEKKARDEGIFAGLRHRQAC